MALSGLASDVARSAMQKTTSQAAKDGALTAEAALKATEDIKPHVVYAPDQRVTTQADVAATLNTVQPANNGASAPASGFWDVFNKVFGKVANGVSEHEYGHKF